MQKIFIINPLSGNGTGLKTGKKIEIYNQKYNKNFEIHYTSKKGEATEIARKYKNKKNIIYAVGGDGTINEVLNGIINTKNLLSIIPAGSGNDFYKTIEKRREDIINLDIPKVNNRYFINVTSIGIDAEIGENANLFKKHLPKSQIYNASILYTFFKYKFKKMKFKLDHVIKEDKFTMVTINNGIYYGGGLPISPTSKIDDGMLEVHFVDKINKVSIIPLLNKLKKGIHETNPNVHLRRCKKIVLECDREIICGIDGESLKGKKFTIKLADKIKFYNDYNFVKKIIK